MILVQLNDGRILPLESIFNEIAKDSMFWVGLGKNIRDLIKSILKELDSEQ